MGLEKEGKGGKKKKTHVLIRNRFGRLAHQHLDALDAAHLGLDVLEDHRALLQAVDDVLLYLGELDVAHKLLELVELPVRLLEERLLVLLAAEGQQGALLVARRQHLPRYRGLLVGQHRYAPLVLVQLVALEFEV
jgi:hypothetical protein